jgi:hypothetical protein
MKTAAHIAALMAAIAIVPKRDHSVRLRLVV